MKSLDANAIRAAMSDVACAELTQLEILPTIDSTNRYALEKSFASSGFACIAEEQTAGRGRRGKSWVSPPDANLYLSLLWNFSAELSVMGLSLAAGIAVAKALKCYGLENVCLKWPNDVLYAQRKLAGVLVELASDTMHKHKTVIGIGLNVAMPINIAEHIDQPWIDVQSIIGMQPDRNYLAALLLENLIRMALQFQQDGLSSFLDEWIHLDTLHKQPVHIYTGNETIKGIAQGIDAHGNLRVRCQEGERSVNSGEVSVRRAV